jgi:hypothetical protein
MSGHKVGFFLMDKGEDVNAILMTSESVIKFELDHKEGKPACLSISILYEKREDFSNPMEKRGVLFFIDNQNKREILFNGYVSNVSSGSDGVMVLCLEACFPEKKQEDEMRIMNTLKKSDYWNEFLDDGNLDSALGIFALCPYWDRATAEMGISHAFESKKEEIDLVNLVDPKSLVVHEKKPISLVDVDISTQWLQQWSQYQDIFPVIAEKFSDRMVATYTASSLNASWPKSGPIKRSGYQVFYSHVWESNPPMSKRTFFSKNGHLFKKFYFDGQIIVGRRYRQKRKEALRFQMKSSFSGHENVGKRLTLNLGCLVSKDLLDICDFSSMNTYKKNDKVKHCGKVYLFRHEEKFVFSFNEADWIFSQNDSDKMKLSLQDAFFISKETRDFTEEGMFVFRSALKRAESLLIWESRTVDIRVRVPFFSCRHMTVDHMATVWDPQRSRLLRGKIVSMCTKVDADEAWTDVIIKAIPTDLKKRDQMYTQREFDENRNQCIDGMYYDIVHYRGPINPVEDTMRNHLCTKQCITIQNSPEQQEKIIGSYSKLSKVGGTSIRISFPSLKTKSCLENTVSVNVWSLCDIHKKYLAQ